MMKLITFVFVLQFIIACWPKTDISLHCSKWRNISKFCCGCDLDQKISNVECF